MKKYECLKQTVGKKRSKENNAWTNMIQRCTNPNRPDYKYYGDRGITVCPEWLNSFGQFLKNMGNCPEGMSLDRIDNSKNYEPNNCRWATKNEQMQNTRKTMIITYKDISMGLAA